MPSLEGRYLNLMTQKIAIKAFSKYSTDGQGAPLFSGTNTTYQGHFEYNRRLVWGKEGQLNIPYPVMYLATTALIDPRSRAIFQGTTYRIEKVIQKYDDGGVHHVRLELVGG